MKRTILFLIVGFLIFSAYSQKATDSKITFEYVRPPLKPFSKEIKTYSADVILVYEAEIKKKKAEHQRKEQEAEAKYEEDMKQYEIDVKEAEAAYEKDMKAYNDKSFGEKLVDKKILNESQPTKKYVSKPYKQLPSEEKYQKIFDKGVLGSKIKLEGYDKSGHGGKITVSLQGFDMSGPEIRETKGTKVVNGESRQVMYYQASTKYKHPIYVKIEDPSKGVLVDEFVEVCNDYTIDRSKSVDSRSKVSYYETDEYKEKLENKIIDANILLVNEFVNSKCGFSQIERKTMLRSAKGKKYNYDDYEQAFQKAQTAYNMMADNKEEATKQLQEAIGLWENALKESNVTDKKARVNRDVDFATRLNLIEACCFTDKFDKANTHMTKLYSMSPSKKEKKTMDEMKEFMKDAKTRFEANKS